MCSNNSAEQGTPYSGYSGSADWQKKDRRRAFRGAWNDDAIPTNVFLWGKICLGEKGRERVRVTELIGSLQHCSLHHAHLAQTETNETRNPSLVDFRVLVGDRLLGTGEATNYGEKS